ncbi:MAG: DUF2752 domain-containing protein [Lachnospiraceae bacterium]|nr:DUF2752 domain-containing protein [Lachnospiraceae bacterium]
MNKREFNDDLTDIWFKIGIVFGAVSVIFVAAFVFFGDYLAHGGLECAVFKYLHIYCPGCGGTRSFNHFIHGNIIQSILCNPFVPYTYITYIVFMINTILVKTTKKIGFSSFPVTILIYAGIGILFLQWIIRNVLWLAFKITCL